MSIRKLIHRVSNWFASAPSRPHRRSSLGFEMLEDRLVPSATLLSGSLQITGTEQSDVITIDRTTQEFVVTVATGTTTEVQRFDASRVSSISVNGLGSADTINVERIDKAIPVTLNGGTGNDTINLSPTARNLSTLNGLSDIRIDGGTESDTVQIFDQNNTSYNRYEVRKDSVRMTTATDIPYFKTIDYSGVENLYLNTGLTVDSNGQRQTQIDVYGTSAETWLTTNTFRDVVNVGQSFTLDGLQKNLWIKDSGGSGVDSLNVNDDGSSVGRNYSVGSAWSPWGGFGDYVGRTGGARVNYTGMEYATLNTGNYDDVVTVQSNLYGSLIVDTNEGSDSLSGPSLSGGTFRVDGLNTGTLNTQLRFQDVDNLFGGGGADRFIFTNGGFVSGNVNGGGGSDSLEYSKYGSIPTMRYIDKAMTSGKATGIGGSFSSIESVVGVSWIYNLSKPTYSL